VPRDPTETERERDREGAKPRARVLAPQCVSNCVTMTDERRRQSGRVWCGLCSLVRPINCTYVATAAVVVVALILLQIQSNPHTLIFTNRSWSAKDQYKVIICLK